MLRAPVINERSPGLDPNRPTTWKQLQQTHSLHMQTQQPDDHRQDLRGQLEVEREELIMPQFKAGPDFPITNTAPTRALLLDDSGQFFQRFDHQAISAQEDDLEDVYYEGIAKEKQASVKADHLFDSHQMRGAAY